MISASRAATAVSAGTLAAGSADIGRAANVGMATGVGLSPASYHESGRAPNRMVHHQKCDGAHDGHQDAVKIQSSDSTGAEEIEQPSSSDGSDDSEHEVENEPLASLVNDLAADESGDQPQNNPSEKRHDSSSIGQLSSNPPKDKFGARTH